MLRSGAFQVSPGGVEAVRLFVLGENDNRCLGAIGSSGEKFCTLMCMDGSQRCDIKSHSTKVDVESSCVFIRVPEHGRGKNAAFCKPFLQVDRVAEKLSMLQEKEFSVKAWNRIFSGFENLEDISEEAFNTLCQRSILEPQVPFTAMKKRRATEEPTPDLDDLGLMDPLPVASIKGKFASFSEDEDFAFKEAWSNLISCVTTLRSDLPKMKSRLKRTKIDLEVAIEGVESSVELLATDIGMDPGIDHGSPVTSVWSGIQLAIRSAQEAHSLLREQEKMISTTSAALKTNEIATSASVNMLRSDIDNISSHVRHLIQDLETSVGPSLEKLIDGYRVGAGTTNLPLGFILERLRALESTSSSTNSGVPIGGPAFRQNAPYNDTGLATRDQSQLESSVTSLAEEIKNLHDRYANINDRLHSNSVQVDDFVFGSRVDTERWVREHVPGNEPDGFHDIMTILQLVTDPHISFKDGMDEAYLSTKVGFTSSSSARNAHSFRCVLPDIFGRMVLGSDKGFPLPALKSQKIWNPNDGVSGVRRSTTQSLKFQVENIKLMLSHFYGSSKAYQLAFTMLSKSYAFWVSLANWIDEFHMKLTIVSCCTSEEAWLLVASCIRGIFRELRRVRICAQEAEKLPDKATSCALFLWGSLQAHRVMDQFLIHSFEGHPVITPVINMHLFQYRVPISMHNSLKAKVLSMEKMLVDHRKELDRLKTAGNKKTSG